jgi:tetratricopeptide (TPR) repeat protein
LLGEDHVNLNEYEQGLSEYGRISGITANPIELAQAQYCIGNAYQKMQRYESALSAYKESLRLNPGQAHPLRELGMAHYHLRQYPQAVASLIQAVRLKPDDAQAQLDLGCAYNASGKRDEAMQVYRRLETLDKQGASMLLGIINTPKSGAAAPGSGPE